MANVMTALIRLVVLASIILSAAAAPAVFAQQPPTEPQEEFLPLDQLPPQDQLPAAPLLVAAYSFVVVALFVYLVTVSRRLSAVKQDIERLESDVRRSGRT